MSITLTIGHWVEKESRDVTQCPSYYAADTETLKTRPGNYPLRLVFEGGYTIPMPYWLLVRVEADRTAGRLYSGFGGVNFASTDLPKEPTPLHLQLYAYTLKQLVDEGKAIVAPEFAGLVADHKEQIEWARKHSWDLLGAMAHADDPQNPEEVVA